MSQGPPKWTPYLPLIDLSSFQGSLTNLGASGGLRSQIYTLSIMLEVHSGPPPCQHGQISTVQNGSYKNRCPAYSTICFMWNSHLLRHFGPLKSVQHYSCRFRRLVHQIFFSSKSIVSKSPNQLILLICTLSSTRQPQCMVNKGVWEEEPVFPFFS